jgi:beta-glucosidase
MIELEAGASKKVSFEISEELLKFYSASKIWEAEPGRFSLFIGTNSSTKRKADFQLN